MSFLTKLFLYINKQNGESFITSKEVPDKTPAIFYAVDKEFRPLPPNTQMIGLTNTNFSTVGFSILYDINEEATLKFIAWTRPVPHTTPVYVAKDGKVSLEPKEEYKPLYLLTEPINTFVNDNFGNCLPAKDQGYLMSECIENISRDYQGRPPTLMDSFKDGVVRVKYKTKFVVLGTAVVIAIFLAIVYFFRGVE
jgi:hypothetical protein